MEKNSENFIIEANEGKVGMKIRELLVLVIVLFVWSCSSDRYRPPADPICGNGKVEEGEECDDGNTAAGDGCSPYCREEGRCGDSHLDPMEQCDGSDFGGITCQSIGFSGGDIRCTAACTLDVSGCLLNTSGKCGDGIIESGEQCDSDDLGGQTCESRGYAAGQLRCTSGCRFDESLCTNEVPSTCGNGIIESGEQCDGQDFGSETCESMGFDGGTLGCTSECMIDTAGCHRCGNGVVEDGEECDGTDLAGHTCSDYGFTGGFIMCSGCQIDTSNCENVDFTCDPMATGECPSGDKCLVIPGGDATCIPEGSGTDGDACDDHEDCAAGYYCIQSFDNGLCTKLCHDNSDSVYDTQDCGASDSSVCAYSISNFDYALCSTGCDLMTGAPCENPPFTCQVLRFRRDGNLITMTDCIDDTECPPDSGNYCIQGQACVRVSGTYYECMDWCRMGQYDCEDEDTCESLVPPVVIDGQEYGVCR